MMKDCIIKADGTEVPINSDEMSLEEMQKAVGGYIEIVGSYHNKYIIADEEGLLKNKPVNFKASYLCYRPIVGDVLLINKNKMK